MATAITDRPEWRALLAGPGGWDALQAVSGLVELADIPHLISLVRDAPAPVGTAAHGVLSVALRRLRDAVPAEEVRAFGLAILHRHSGALAAWRSSPCKETLSGAYDVITYLPEGAPYSVLVERLGPPARADPGIPGKRNASCHYNAGGTHGMDVFLEADSNDGLAAWRMSC